MTDAGRCLVVHPGALGDVLLARPALARLGDLGYARTLAAAPRLAGLLVAGGAVETGVDFEALGLHHLFAATPHPPHPLHPEVAARLGAFDLIVSWFGSGDPTYGSQLQTTARRVVVAGATPAPGVSMHVSAHLLATLAPVGSPVASVRIPRLVVSVPARAWVARWLEGLGLGAGEAVVVQAGAGRPAKVWPAAPALARRLRAAGWPVVVTAGPADDDALACLLDEGGILSSGVARDWPLDRLAALLALSRAFVGHDSGPTHLAAAVGCPTLALFGPTDPVVWRPMGERVRVLAGAGPGAPDPWEGLDVDGALAALEGLVGRDRPGEAAAMDSFGAAKVARAPA